MTILRKEGISPLWAVKEMLSEIEKKVTLGYFPETIRCLNS